MRRHRERRLMERAKMRFMPRPRMNLAWAVACRKLFGWVRMR